MSWLSKCVAEYADVNRSPHAGTEAALWKFRSQIRLTSTCEVSFYFVFSFVVEKVSRYDGVQGRPRLISSILEKTRFTIFLR